MLSTSRFVVLRRIPSSGLRSFSKKKNHHQKPPHRQYAKNDHPISTMDLVKRLRFETGAPIVECRKALTEVNNDLDSAKDWLREHGAAKVQSKNRLAADGLVGLMLDGTQSAGLVQVASETDFTARSAEFVKLVAHTAKAAMLYPERNTEVMIEKILAAKPGGDDEPTVKHVLDEAVVAIRENLSISKAIQLHSEDPNRFLVGYVHNRVENDHGVLAGTAGAVVELERVNELLPDVNVQAIGKKLAMHVVAVCPLYLTVDDIPDADVERERDFLTEQVVKKAKKGNEHLTPKIVAGKLQKYFAQLCLSEQNHSIEESMMKIGPGLRDIGVEIKRFERLSVV